jgi:hypothetical protein
VRSQSDAVEITALGDTRVPDLVEVAKARLREGDDEEIRELMIYMAAVLTAKWRHDDNEELAVITEADV